MGQSSFGKIKLFSGPGGKYQKRFTDPKKEKKKEVKANKIFIFLFVLCSWSWHDDEWEVIKKYCRKEIQNPVHICKDLPGDEIECKEGHYWKCLEFFAILYRFEMIDKYKEELKNKIKK